jgi:hypothetical protein
VMVENGSLTTIDHSFLCGGSIGYLLVNYCNIVGGRPLLSLPLFSPILRQALCDNHWAEIVSIAWTHVSYVRSVLMG